jgi:hypothetical protein
MIGPRIKSSNGFSSQVRSKIDNKKYIISTAKDPSGHWQTAIFKVNFLGYSNPFKPLQFWISSIIEEAEKKHSKVEEPVENYQIEEWIMNYSTIDEGSMD